MVIEKKILLRDKNSYKIGGYAEFYVEPRSEEDIKEAVIWASEKSLPVFFLGRGSNVLISDAGWNGLVINLSESFHEITWNHNRAIAQSGAMLNTLVSKSIERALAGLEELIGIPGTVGGAVIMNAGAYSMTVGESVEWVRYIDLSENKILTLNRNEMKFSYRSSYLKDKPGIVLTAGFLFKENVKSTEELVAIKNSIQSKRKEKQPLEYPSCGSVFKRPPDNYAGTLIEKCGLKGTRIGGVEVSEKHANFIINRGGGTAEDVRKLIALVQQKVFECSGILLEPEVIFIGSFKNSLYIPKV